MVMIHAIGFGALYSQLSSVNGERFRRRDRAGHSLVP